MGYIDLNRNFIPIDKDEENHLEWGRYLGLNNRIGWEQLLKKERVVILAEADSGKTTEFENIQKKLQDAGMAAFFCRIEVLATDDFVQPLNMADMHLFESWKQSNDVGYFFLDSKDEAQLINRHYFEKALNKLSKSLAELLTRTRIFISCRVTDWRGDGDCQTITQYLPIPKQALVAKPNIDPETALLTPIFKNRGIQNKQDEQQVTVENEPEITIVRLLPLDSEQQRKLAQENGVANLEAFSQAIWKQGLDNLAERPGDLLELVDYWQDHQKFGSLSKMLAHSISLKLSERDPDRPDNHILTSEKAREGAERIAATLTLGKAFTLQTLDATHLPDALNPRKILPDWTDAERNALLRRGIFAPATYGRVRFHHRTTQEYLTAQWLNRLLAQNCPHSEIFNLLFVDVYGVKTVVPSLKPIAAWLALTHDDIRDEIIKRDPLILIQHGDPGSLPIEACRQLLFSYAEKHRKGDIANDSLDHRALWMFADTELAESILKVWNTYDNADFRGDLIRLIREGAIAECCDLAVQLADDKQAHEYHRIVAVQALSKCDISASLKRIAANLLENAPNTSARLATGFACELFPRYLDVEQLIELITRVKPPSKYSSTEGFGFAITALWGKCPSNRKMQLIGKLAKLALSKPFIYEYRRISKTYGHLAGNFAPIAHQLVIELGNKEPTDELIQVLMAIERSEHSYFLRDLQPSLNNLVQSMPKIQRKLFWANVDEEKDNQQEQKAVTRYWEVYYFTNGLCELGTNDLHWLYEDLEQKTSESDKALVFNIILRILVSTQSLERERTALYQRIQNFPIFVESLNNVFMPIIETEQQREFRLSREQYAEEQKIEATKTKEFWLTLRNELIANPSQITNPEERLRCVEDLIHWLLLETAQEEIKAARQWHLLTQAFNNEVAEAFRDAMKALWRDTKPERPKHKGNRQAKSQGIHVYAFAGIGIEADESRERATMLSPEEAKRAAEYACLSENDYPDWLDDLVAAHPSIAIPLIVKTCRDEWTATQSWHGYFLFHYQDHIERANPEIADKLFEIISNTKPTHINRLETGITILQKMVLSESQKKLLKRRGTKHFENAINSEDKSFAIRYLALLFQIDPAYALQKMRAWIENSEADTQTGLAIQIIARIFYGLIGDELNNAPIKSLKELVLLAYRYVKPADDVKHDGVFTPDSSDDAEQARNVLLSALRKSTGFEAHQAMIQLADAPEMTGRTNRLRQIARDMAERDAEFPAWTENETLTFANKFIAPIKNADALYYCVLGILDNIRHDFEHSDASSRKLLSRLADIGQDDEKSVQNWLGEQLRLRANGKYHVHREAEVANHDMPDIIVAGTTGQFEIAIEVKQADSWSPKELKTALTKQLAEDYLKTQTRRHGILFLTDHGRRKWTHPDNKTQLSFNELQTYLAAFAKTKNENSTGKIEVSVLGIDTKLKAKS